ncbi:MAG: MBL fold metallo-hydrolase [Thermoplasmatota archaeon]
MTFRCRFLGAAEDIGRLGFVVESHGSRYLFDYGIAPERPPEYPLPAPSIDQAFLTHAHMDHSGMVPWLSAHTEATVMTTPVTAEVSTLMHHDSLKIARSEGYPEPFDDHDISESQRRYEDVDFRYPRQVGGMSARFHSAGHIPGAAQVELRGDSSAMVFTGDLYTRPQNLVGAGRPVKCDVLCMETTYAGREHPDRQQTEKDFIAFCQDVADRGGTTIAAAFAVGRAQELAMVLAHSGLTVWMDGMARKIATIYGRHPEYLGDARAYQRAMRQVKYVRSHRTRATALKEADVIITTSGMLEGGPILYYADQLRNDKKSAIAVTGYQVKGTNGRRLMDEGVLDVDMRDPGRKVYPIHCEVRHFDFSAHAGHEDLVKFAKATGAEDIVLFHGDNREALEPDLSDFANVHMPMRGDEFVIH